jgi:uncharacterized protein YggE
MQKQYPINWKTITAAAMVVVVVLALFNLAVTPAAAQTSDKTDRVITVSGSGQASGTPDVAYLSLGVDTTDADVGKAVEKTNQAINAVTEALKAAGVDAKDIQTTNFNVYPEDRTDPKTGAPSGERVYHVQNSVSIIVRDIKKTGVVIDAGLKAGANTLNGLSFGIADTKKLEQEARLNAVNDAKDRASQLAEAFGVKVGAVVAVNESAGRVYSPPVAFKSEALVNNTTDIKPGQMSVNVDIEVSFAIEQ